MTKIRKVDYNTTKIYFSGLDWVEFDINNNADIQYIDDDHYNQGSFQPMNTIVSRYKKALKSCGKAKYNSIKTEDRTYIFYN